MSDLVSRQAAIDALRYAQHRFTVADEAGGIGTVKWSEDVIYFAAAERVLAELPSAQPDQPPYVAEIESEYRKAVNMPYIKKPLAKALYEVWKKHDREDVSRNG